MRTRLFVIAALLCASLAGAQSMVTTRPPGGGSSNPFLLPGAVLLAPSGCAAPPYSFTGRTTFGLCSPDADTVRVQTKAATGPTSGALELAGAGGYSALVHYDAVGATSGVFVLDAAHHFTLGGNVNFRISTTEARLRSTFGYNWSSGDPAAAASDTGLARATNGVVKVTNGGAGSGTIRTGDGALPTAPAYSFTSNTTTGMLLNAANDLWLVTNGQSNPYNYLRLQPSGASLSYQDAGGEITALTLSADIASLSSKNATQSFSLDASSTNTAILTAPAFNLAPAHLEGGSAKTLTDNTKTAFVKVAVPVTSFAGGDVIWTLYCQDASDRVARSGRLPWTAINDGGTVTCSLGPSSDSGDAGGTAGPPTFVAVTFTCADTAANQVQLEVQADCSLVPTALSISYRLDMPTPNTVTPQ